MFLLSLLQSKVKICLSSNPLNSYSIYFDLKSLIMVQYAGVKIVIALNSSHACKNPERKAYVGKREKERTGV